MKNKIKIGDMEFTLPFKADARDVTDKNHKYTAEVDSYNNDWADAVAIAQTIATALNEHFSRRWMKVSDGLPEPRNYFVTWRDSGSGEIGVACGYFDGTDWFCEEGGLDADEDVIAWQDARLPEPFEGDEK